MELDQKYLESIVKPLCEYPEDVSTERKVDEMGVLISLRVNDDDVPFIVGKRGYVASAIRKVLRLYGAKHKKNITLRVLQPDGYVKEERDPVTSFRPI